ncbi:cell division ATP-binding protein FtsE [Gardnerella vaginalis]|uniref:cell division ATP-binding protein FtsE n=1 Tax=Gardnerella vaginalis TaxID=2702 RepID=UPI0039F13AA6
MSLMSLEHVSKIYPKGSRPALDDISLDVNRGDFVFLVGASGSGKTTLLSLLLREEEATSGEIHVAGNDLRRLANRQVPQYRRSLGFIFQDYKLLNNKTVYQNVAFALEVIGTSRATIRSLVPRVLETVGLTGKENNYPHELSGGEAQRVAIARAYVNHPQIILADEPTGNLDPTTSLGIMEVLDAINRTGTTIVMATHNEEIVNSMRKRVVELHAGKIVRDEREGSYDSALYFPDADVEQKSKAQQSVEKNEEEHEISAASEQPERTERHKRLSKKAQRAAQARETVDIVTQYLQSDTSENEGIARLAQSVHSGRTGRYGEVFQSLETTMTWGRGLSLNNAESSEKSGLNEGSESNEGSVAKEKAEVKKDAEANEANVANNESAVASEDSEAKEDSVVKEVAVSKEDVVSKEDSEVKEAAVVKESAMPPAPPKPPVASSNTHNKKASAEDASAEDASATDASAVNSDNDTDKAEGEK